MIERIYIYIYIYIAHVIIIKSEVSTFPIVTIFSVVVCLRCLLHHILSLIVYTFRENREFVFIIIVQFMIVQIFWYVLACRSYSFVCTVHHLIIIIVQTYPMALKLQNACQKYFVECVSKIKHILSVNPLYNMWGCMFSDYPFLLWWLREHIYFVLLSSSNRKYELLPIV